MNRLDSVHGIVSLRLESIERMPDGSHCRRIRVCDGRGAFNETTYFGDTAEALMTAEERQRACTSKVVSGPVPEELRKAVESMPPVDLAEQHPAAFVDGTTGDALAKRLGANGQIEEVSIRDALGL